MAYKPAKHRQADKDDYLPLVGMLITGLMAGLTAYFLVTALQNATNHPIIQSEVPPTTCQVCPTCCQ